MNMLSDEMAHGNDFRRDMFRCDDVGDAHAKDVTQSCTTQLATKGGER